MAVDEALRLLGVLGPDRNPDVGDAVDAQRERSTAAESDDKQRRDAVALEQPADDARLDVGRAPEDDRQIRPSTGSIDLQNHHRNVVVLRLPAARSGDVVEQPVANRLGRAQIGVRLEERR